MVLNIVQTNNEITKTICRQKPSATARVRGSEEYKNIRGTVDFYKVSSGVLVVAEIFWFASK